MATPLGTLRDRSCLRGSEISELEVHLSKFDRQTMDPAVPGEEAKGRRTHQSLLSQREVERVEVSDVLPQKE